MASVTLRQEFISFVSGACTAYGSPSEVVGATGIEPVTPTDVNNVFSLILQNSLNRYVDSVRRLITFCSISCSLVEFN